MTYKSMNECSEATGYPKSILVLAKSEGGPGFHKDGRIDWLKLEPWLVEHENELEIANDDLTKARTRKMQAEADMAEMERDRMQNRYVDINEVKTFLHQIARSQSVILTSKLRDELPPKLLGLGVIEMTAIMEQTLQDVFKLMREMKLGEE